MKIYVLGSTSFAHEMVEAKDELCRLGFEGWIHPHYQDFVKGERETTYARWKKAGPGERAAIKRENNYFHEHYQHILESDAVLIVNAEKNGIKNYIGGNVLIEMGQAYVNHKSIYFLHDMPQDLPYQDEIEALNPICLNGELSKIGEVLKRF